MAKVVVTILENLSYGHQLSTQLSRLGVSEVVLPETKTEALQVVEKLTPYDLSVRSLLGCDVQVATLAIERRVPVIFTDTLGFSRQLTPLQVAHKVRRKLK